MHRSKTTFRVKSDANVLFGKDFLIQICWQLFAEICLILTRLIQNQITVLIRTNSRCGKLPRFQVLEVSAP